MELKGKIVVVTGASGGIGALSAQMAAERGAIPVLVARSEDKLKAIAGSLPGEYGMYRCDVGSSAEVEETFARIFGVYGRVDVLLNNAGFGRFALTPETGIDEYEKMMNVNYMGTVRCTKAVLPKMLEQGAGRIINVASMAGKIATAKSTAYSASKHAVLGFTNALRQELRGSGVTVSAVNPGPIDTEFFDIADPDGTYVKNLGGMIMKPSYVAKKIVGVMESGREEVDLPRWAAWAIRAYGMVPRLADRLTYKSMSRK
ncbi:SDR family NAD(P)-dependent oxidoreductase [Paenibacillus glufosinatiresistens]|uniref:SDR family NAD(P)-dependent oxidoreductase n=1 Tax=Paenibacillus glufosinatiresistens TaxID=3070657 RepID=UPI00286DF247|nr:SDR family oxidoreductase [Paenibacillus sp. YX.27]